MGKIELTILGDPRAQKRHRSFRRGKFAGTYDASTPDKKDFLAVVQDKAPEQPFKGPLTLEIALFMRRPKAHYGTGRNAGRLKDNAEAWHSKRPDLDNCVKFIMDALNGVFWLDDAQVAQLVVAKGYDEKPRTYIEIEELGDG